MNPSSAMFIVPAPARSRILATLRWLRVAGLSAVALSILITAVAFVPAAAAGDGHAIRQIALSELAIFAVLGIIVARSGRDRKPALRSPTNIG